MVKHFTAADLVSLEKVFRINLVNSLPGFRAANLIATRSAEGQTNVAIFNSVIHLGANPALMGFVMRPHTVPRQTYEYIKESGYFTINHVTQSMIDRAHQTSAKYDSDISEFDSCNIESVYQDDFYAPYVAESPIQIGLRYVEDHLITANDTILVVGAVEQLYVQESCLTANGTLDLSATDTVALSGLDGYYSTTWLKSLGYARVGE